MLACMKGYLVRLRRAAVAASLLGGAALFTAAGIAQTPTASGKRQLLEGVTACTAIRDDAARLACFDAAVPRLAEAHARKELIVVERDEVVKTRRSLFGLTLPDIKLFGGNDGIDPPMQEITGTIQSVSSRQLDFYTIVLDDKSVWAFTESMPVDPRKGQKITIRRASLGGYIGTLPGRTGKRIRRVN